MAGARDWEVSKRSFLAKTRQPKGNGRPRKPNSRRLEKNGACEQARGHNIEEGRWYQPASGHCLVTGDKGKHVRIAEGLPENAVAHRHPK